MLTLALIGGVMLGRGIDAALRHTRPQEMRGDVHIANLECALTRHAQPWTRTWKMSHFRADPGAAHFLQTAGIDACSLANNHTPDFETRGLMDTLHTLDAAGIRHACAGGQVALARGEDFAAICEWMGEHCAELGTALQRQADRLVYEPGP